ncbi:MAG TPA: branched-chain amino acid ABC transporter permease [Stellaceae bacterium]|nr:branched-chain amino acid ABC transporter permease [Stellaceae bacterium]
MIWVIDTLNGIAFGMLLFLLAAGLSLIYGLMKILNLTHGSFYLVGGYIGLTVMQRTGSFVLALIVAALAIGLIGAVIERFFLRRFHLDELPQTLLTFGFLFIFADLSLWIWGGDPIMITQPQIFAASVPMGDYAYPLYRLFLIVVGLVIAGALWWFQEHTRLGTMLRAGVDDAEIARALGINVSLLFTLVFAAGAALAAIGGVLAGPVLSLYPGADFDTLILAFVVVIVGGLGSLRGALAGALLVGLLDNFGKSFFPQFALFTVFVPMAIILVVRPTGLFGRR